MQGKWKNKFETSGSFTLSRDVVLAKSTIVKFLKPKQPNADIDWQVKMILLPSLVQGNNWTVVDILVELSAMNRADVPTLVAVPGVPAVTRVEVQSVPEPRTCRYGSQYAYNRSTGRCSCGHNCAAPPPRNACDMPLTQACTFPTMKLKMEVNTSVTSVQVYITITHYSEWSCTLSKASSRTGVPLTTSLEALLSSGGLADVKFLVGGEEIAAHSQILAAVSDVFHAMFTVDTRDARTGRVSVQDAHPAVFHEMLR